MPQSWLIIPFFNNFLISYDAVKSIREHAEKSVTPSYEAIVSEAMQADSKEDEHTQNIGDDFCEHTRIDSLTLIGEIGSSKLPQNQTHQNYLIS